MFQIKATKLHHLKRCTLFNNKESQRSLSLEVKNYCYLLLLLPSVSCLAEENNTAAPCCYAHPSKKSQITSGPSMESGIHISPDSLVIMTEEQQWPVEFATDYQSSQQSLSEENSSKVTIEEVNLGFRKDWNLQSLPFSPYLGGGVAIARAEQETSHVDAKNEDRSVGNWYQVGALFDINENFSLGINVEVNNTHLNISGEDVKSRQVHTGISTTFKW